MGLLAQVAVVLHSCSEGSPLVEALLQIRLGLLRGLFRGCVVFSPRDHPLLSLRLPAGLPEELAAAAWSWLVPFGVGVHAEPIQALGAPDQWVEVLGHLVQGLLHGIGDGPSPATYSCGANSREASSRLLLRQLRSMLLRLTGKKLKVEVLFSGDFPAGGVKAGG